ncbi:MAG: LacI family DNA-binding transcriptional regulator [Proteobacteria bacterium]|nr:LacI family DNA-binding transcriptional regulator [Pseudomonadota bacterium]
MVVRMKDIAAELDVSVMTVSKVLHNKGRISAATRERILRRIDELGYQPNVNARNLVSGRSFLIGLIVPDLMHPFFAALAKIISRNLRGKGYGIAISSSEEDPAIERQEISAFLARRADALILASSQRSATAFKRLEDEGIPYILADRMIRGLNANFIGSDDKAIGVLATEHLITRGYRRIAHIGMPGISTGNLRLQGYRATLKRHRQPLSSQWVVTVESSDERGEQCGFDAMQKLLSLKQRPDAVFCYNDVLAYGAFKAIFEAGLRVPADVGVVGVANMASFSFWDASPVGLTTIDQNVPQLADAISELVLVLVERPQRAPSRRILLQPKLVIRGST